MRFKNDAEGSTYIVQSVEASEAVVGGEGAIENGLERQWHCRQLESCWSGVGSTRDGKNRRRSVNDI